MTSSETPAAAGQEAAYRYTAALAADIEARWQDRWEKEGTFHAPNPVGDLADQSRGPHGELPAEKHFILDMFPYPSGAGLHVGHPLQLAQVGGDLLLHGTHRVEHPLAAVALAAVVASDISSDFTRRIAYTG